MTYLLLPLVHARTLQRRQLDKVGVDLVHDERRRLNECPHADLRLVRDIARVAELVAQRFEGFGGEAGA